MSRDEDRKTQSRRIIDRVGAETEASMARRVANHMAARDADQKDWAELWGTRIGRVLGVILFCYLIYWLIDFVMNRA